MPHSFVIPEQVLSTAIALVTDDLALAATVNRDYEDAFGGGRGTVVNVRVPATLKARRRKLTEDGTPIVVDTVTEETVPVTMTEHVYSATDVSDVQMRMDIADFSRQVTVPQVRGMVEDLENLVAETMQALPESLGIAFDAAAPHKTFNAARKTLRDLGVPQAGMFATVGTDVYRQLLDARVLSDAGQSGSTAALRNATVGSLSGFTVVENNRIDEDEIIWYSRDAFTLAIRAPYPPDGAAFSASTSEGNFAMTWIKDYDASILKNRSVFQTYAGCQAMQIKRLAKDGTTTKVVPALRVKTSTVPA
ncbi:P22 coat protein Gp5 [Micromonospora sp. M71_S20]|uniref:P22 phage major capsid protein family protein n=1 Tax=Micromonospora sp. M71_S20 TaxID=592872 RepID=UPI000EB4E643|nr:P22 phage major capsid protein family protein [Micromonospora sp. M71_S20]RLK22636.1 P22 coat protein Gp5 [Micromonospora sp. M71_S20]